MKNISCGDDDTNVLVKRLETEQVFVANVYSSLKNCYKKHSTYFMNPNLLYHYL